MINPEDRPNFKNINYFINNELKSIYKPKEIHKTKTDSELEKINEELEKINEELENLKKLENLELTNLRTKLYGKVSINKI